MTFRSQDAGPLSFDLTGLARLRWRVRPSSIRSRLRMLADGTDVASHRGISTDGELAQVDVVFS